MKKIFLNPGHAPNGIPDPGAINMFVGVKEANITKAIADQVNNLLIGAGYDVCVYQSDSLNDICRKANGLDVDYFVSIHCNASWNGQGTGTEVFCYEFFTEAAELAGSIQNQIVHKLDMYDRGVKEASYQVLRCTNMPAVLIECGFIDNDDDVHKLINKQDVFAEAIYKGIINYIEG